MSEQQIPSPATPRPYENPRGDDITLLDVAIVVAKYKKLIFGLPVVAALAAIVIALLLPKIYTATVRILPPQQKESSAAAMLGAIGGATAPGSSIGQVLSLRNPNDLYIGILRSRTIADRLIKRFALTEQYRASSMTDTRGALERATKISAGKNGLITIEVDGGDPQRAADIANAYVEELDRLMQGLAVTEASQRRLFFEEQLANTQRKLSQAEISLRQSIEAKGITGADAQTRAVVGTTEQLRAQIAVKEIQLDAMRAFATEQNPEAVRLTREIGSMKTELGKLEGGRKANTTQSSAGLESLQMLREVKFLEFTADLLTKQYEIAKIDEAKDAILIQVLDKAIPPDHKSKPRRALIVTVATLGAAVLAVLLAFIMEAIGKVASNPDNRMRVDLFRRHLRF